MFMLLFVVFILLRVSLLCSMCFLLLDFARGCFILPMLFDAAICLSHSSYFARCCNFVFCLNLLSVGYVAIFAAMFFYMAVLYPMLLIFSRCL